MWDKPPMGGSGGSGKSAYQTWIDQGNTGTEQDFLLSLKGAKGDTGQAGTTSTSINDSATNTSQTWTSDKISKSTITFKTWPTGVTKVADILEPGNYHVPINNSVTDIPSIIRPHACYVIVLGAFNNATRMYILLDGGGDSPNNYFYVGWKHSSGTTVYWNKFPVDKFLGQSLCLLGDSITLSIGGTVIGARTGLNITNLAYSGSSIALRTTPNPTIDPWALCTRSKVGATNSIPIENFDYALIFMGTNDWGNSVPMGTVNSMDEQTVLGAYNVAIQNFITRKPTIKLLIATPLYRVDADAGGKYMLLSDLCKGIESLAKKYGIPVMNMYEQGMVNYYNRATFLAGDGLHMGPNGVEHVNNVLAAFVNERY